MNNSYDRCQALYRAARAYESSSQADLHAVRLAVATAVGAGVPAAAAAASATSVAASGIYSAAPGASAAGVKGILHLLLGGKLLSGILVGTVLGTALSTTVFVGIPAMQSRVAVSGQSRPLSEAVVRSSNSGRSSETPDLQQIEQAPAEVPQPRNETTRMETAAGIGQPRALGGTGDRLVVVNPTFSRAAPRQDRLQEETQALARVQDALSLKDPQLAWTLLQEQDRQFQSGQLGEERAAAKVMALCAAGRNVEAEQARAAFASIYPSSPLTKRVNKGCDHR